MAAEQHDGLRQQPLGILLRRLSDQLRTLVRQEMALAKAELGEKARSAKSAAAMLGAAALVGLCALGALTALLILAVDVAIPAWAAALVVTVLLASIAAALGMEGKRRLEAMGSPVPTQTIETTKEDIQWAKTRMQSGRK